MEIKHDEKSKAKHSGIKLASSTEVIHNNCQAKENGTSSLKNETSPPKRRHFRSVFSKRFRLIFKPWKWRRKGNKPERLSGSLRTYSGMLTFSELKQIFVK